MNGIGKSNSKNKVEEVNFEKEILQEIPKSAAKTTFAEINKKYEMKNEPLADYGPIAFEDFRQSLIKAVIPQVVKIIN